MKNLFLAASYVSCSGTLYFPKMDETMSFDLHTLLHIPLPTCHLPLLLLLNLDKLTVLFLTNKVQWKLCCMISKTRLERPCGFSLLPWDILCGDNQWPWKKSNLHAAEAICKSRISINTIFTFTFGILPPPHLLFFLAEYLTYCWGPYIVT